MNEPQPSADTPAFDANAKGELLQEAVQAIESMILETFPAYSAGTFRIEAKKTVVIAEVRHEIDLLVTVAHGSGYDAVFLFECKNWANPIGKNEVVVFSEKIRALNAQRGFFIGTEFTKDATAQAKLDQRMQLVSAAELDPRSIEVPGHFHMVELRAFSVHARIARVGDAPEAEQPLDPATTDFVLDGKPVALEPYLLSWANELRQERLSRFNSVFAAGGTHELDFAGERTFAPGSALIGGRPAKHVELKGTTEVYVARAVIVSAFEIDGRGRRVRVEAAAPSGTIQVSFVQIADPGIGDRQS